MPQAPDHLRAKFEDDAAAHALLVRAGFVLTWDFCWTPPTPDHALTDEQRDAVDYLHLEWDYGGLAWLEVGQ